MDLTVRNTVFAWYMIISNLVNKQIGNSFAKRIYTKGSSKPCQTSEMKLFPQIATGCRGELRILPNIYDGTFCQNSQKRKAVHFFCKKLHLNVWQDSELNVSPLQPETTCRNLHLRYVWEYASELAFEVKEVFIFKSV